MSLPARRSLVRVLGALLLFSFSVSAKGTTPTLEGCNHEVTAPSIHMARSPEQLIRALEWSYDNRSVAAYRELLTDDFRLSCAATDTAGGPGTWTRKDELKFFSELVDRNRVPGLRELTLAFDPNLVVTRDPRPEYARSGQHALIQTGFTLRFAEGTDPIQTLTGQAQFFIVRADTADLAVENGARADRDPRVWYIERWDDVSGGSCSLLGRN